MPADPSAPLRATLGELDPSLEDVSLDGGSEGEPLDPGLGVASFELPSDRPTLSDRKSVV